MVGSGADTGIQYTEVNTSKFLKKNSFTSFDIKIAAAYLLIHFGANSSACSGSEVVIERPCTIMAVFNNAVFEWNWFFQLSICRVLVRKFQPKYGSVTCRLTPHLYVYADVETNGK